MDVYIGFIALFPYSFAPYNWSFCQGQMIGVNQNQALYALLGNTYGGSGQATFGLPDLRGRMPIGAGTNTQGTTYSLGQAAGAAQTTLLQNHMPLHVHPASFSPAQGSSLEVDVKLAASTDVATSDIPLQNGFLAQTTRTGGPAAVTVAGYRGDVGQGQVNLGGVTSTLSGTGGSGTVAVGPAGASQPFSLMNPYLALNFNIAMQGIFPTQG